MELVTVMAASGVEDAIVHTISALDSGRPWSGDCSCGSLDLCHYLGCFKLGLMLAGSRLKLHCVLLEIVSVYMLQL